MVLPIVAGGALVAFIAFGKDLVGEKSFNNIIKVLLGLGIIIASYVIYKMYKTYMGVSNTAGEYIDIVGKYADTAKDKIDVLLNSGQEVMDKAKAGVEDNYEWVTTVKTKDVLSDIDIQAAKLTPGSPKTAWTKESSFIEDVFWTPTKIITGTRDNILDPKSRYEKLKKDLMNAPSWIRSLGK